MPLRDLFSARDPLFAKLCTVRTFGRSRACRACVPVAAHGLEGIPLRHPLFELLKRGIGVGETALGQWRICPPNIERQTLDGIVLAAPRLVPRATGRPFSAP